MVRKSIKYGQNFLVSKRLVADLVRRAHLTGSDVVYEIGTGTGIVTLELSKRCKKVISYEIDLGVLKKAQCLLEGKRNVILRHADFLSMPNPKASYKVFASVPFNITSRLMRKLFIAGYSPDRAYLIVEKGAAKRFMGLPATNWNAMLIYPRFQIRILSELDKHLFRPIPKVDAVFLKISKRQEALVKKREWDAYVWFLRILFCGKRKCAWYNLKGRIRYPEWKRLSRSLGFRIDAKPSELECPQVIALFRYIQESRR